jgi:hypothetical protein
MINQINFFSITLTILLLSFYDLIAQEDNYWNLQYGTRSTLLGGTVIGSVSDLSATYYNPGAIALFQDTKFIISAQAYQYDKYKIKDGAGTNRDLNYSSITPSAGFAAFNIDFGFLKDDKIIVSVLTRVLGEIEFRNRIIDSVEVIESSPGKEDFAGGINYYRKFNEVWAGITYSAKINEIIGIGCTGYIAVKSYQNQSSVILQALKSDGDIASYTRVNNYNYNNWRTLLKGGIGINLNPLTVGISVTTPSLNLFGSGSVGTNLFVSGLDTNRFSSNYQDDVKSEYKTSWAAGFGAAYKLDKYKLHISTEWFNAVNNYYVLDTEPYKSQSSGEVLTNDFTHHTKSIINYGLGLDYFAADSLIFSASFISDYSAKSDDQNLNQPQTLGFNLFHISAGSTFKVWKSLLTLGLVYTYGSQNIGENINLKVGGNSILSSEAELQYSQIKVLIGFEL